ncbi:glycosyl hydrolase family 28 protein [Paraflavitalea sp. CAU 1676]|uniref:glycoside hydrolase family 28 protein n=1 Tax=Paraflavitalea sp. CAU 1676 TaxID=3032598 RepID=UPI0023DCC686|nr:glycosyl hydrolase family 28 protein [Paraflavitalea sp. CAU 1676]MDF2192877.1 glycosyl hydrolase family 28 protein [Paraflavitalea sp. CAU 1676]
MRRIALYGIVASVVLLFSLPALANQPDSIPAHVLAWAKKTGARKQPTNKRIFLVNKYGAVKNGQTLTTAAIQKAIDDCAVKGGGIVTFEPGEYVTGSIFLKSNVHLQIGKGVTLLGSQSFSDYPEIDTRIAGIEMKWPAALINIIGQQNVMVSGEGKVNARGKFCWDKYWTMRRQEYEPKGLRWIVDYDAKRVRTFLVQESADITLKGVTFSNAGFWTVQLLYSKYLTVNGVIIRNNEDGKGPSTDGVDVDSSSWVLIENCDIDCNDDDFCLKAGRDWDGLRVNRPTEYIVIRNSIARKGGGLLTVGSETSGSIRHVLATNLVAMGTGNGFHIKSATTRGGTVEDIYFINNQLDSVGNAFHFTMNWNPTYSYSKLPDGYNYDSIPAHWKAMLQKVEPAEKGIPQFRNIYVSGIKAAGVKRVISATGLSQSLLTGFHFKDVTIDAATTGDISYASGWQFHNVHITSKDKFPLKTTNTDNMQSMPVQ